MSLFTNLYTDKQEIIEWLETDKDAKGSFMQFHSNGDDIQLKELQNWLNENEEYAQKYREYHYGKKWNV